VTPNQLLTIPSELPPVLRAFGLGNPLEIVPLGGTATRKWDVTTTEQRFVVRVRAAEFADLDATRFDHEALRRLSRAGLPVPTPLVNADGSTWLVHEGHTLEVLSWIEGDPFRDGDRAAIRSLGSLLARFHRAGSDDLPPSKKDRLREDHPDLMRPYLAELRRLPLSAGEDRELVHIASLLDEVAAELDAGLYQLLPHSVIHGDVHPGNVRFRDSRVAALYDFDYLGVQARSRDLSDALISFASRRGDTFDPNVMHSLVQPFVPDCSLCGLLLGGYQGESMLTDAEWQALPLLVRSRWIQMRLRGARKVPLDQRIRFVLHRFFEVIEWLDGEGDMFFDTLRQELQPGS
jgi:Ser/Thr protein kinase RdoA (MazF antagonist)